VNFQYNREKLYIYLYNVILLIDKVKLQKFIFQNEHSNIIIIC